MYNPYDDQNEKRTTDIEPEKDTRQASPAEGQPAQQAGYTWPTYTAQTNTPPYYTQPTPPAQGYAWGGQPNNYYNPQPQRQTAASILAPEKKKKKGGRTALKILAAVLCCAVVSLGSVGVFAGLIQSGHIRIESTGDTGTTPAFTLYKLENSAQQTTPTATGQAMTSQEVAQKLIPSVVCVQNYQISQKGFIYGGIEYVPSGSESEVSPAGEGSGIIFSEDGYIVTNQHVVDGATSLKVVTSEGMTYEAELIGEDTQTDLAVLKITTDDKLTPAEFGSSEDLQVTDSVMAIGNPGGMQFNSSVTMGYISALNRQITNSETGFTMSCIQTDAAINPGNSGGALVDMNGHVVGINSSKIVATGYEGLGFAIPADTAQPIISDLIQYGYVKDRPMLGITGQYIDRVTSMFYGLTPGYYVAEVRTQAAQDSGLQKGDVITAIDDTQVTSSSTVTAYLAGKKPGDKVTLTVDRALAGQSGLQLELTLSENTGSSN